MAFFNRILDATGDLLRDMFGFVAPTRDEIGFLKGAPAAKAAPRKAYKKAKPTLDAEVPAPPPSPDLSAMVMETEPKKPEAPEGLKGKIKKKNPGRGSPGNLEKEV